MKIEPRIVAGSLRPIELTLHEIRQAVKLMRMRRQYATIIRRRHLVLDFAMMAHFDARLN